MDEQIHKWCNNCWRMRNFILDGDEYVCMVCGVETISVEEFEKNNELDFIDRNYQLGKEEIKK